MGLCPTVPWPVHPSATRKGGMACLLVGEPSLPPSTKLSFLKPNYVSLHTGSGAPRFSQEDRITRALSRGPPMGWGRPTGTLVVKEDVSRSLESIVLLQQHPSSSLRKSFSACGPAGPRSWEPLSPLVSPRGSCSPLQPVCWTPPPWGAWIISQRVSVSACVTSWSLPVFVTVSVSLPGENSLANLLLKQTLRIPAPASGSKCMGVTALGCPGLGACWEGLGMDHADQGESASWKM